MTGGEPPRRSLTRVETLSEIGLSPQWRLRWQRSVCRVPTDATTSPMTVPVAAATPEARTDPAGSRAFAGAVPERLQGIASMAWPELRQSVATCRTCCLCEERRQAVLGVGDVNADWLFIGEGPGAEEDARGEPFVGVAGKLLDAMLAAIDLQRGHDVYIANAVKCRPPANRTPEPAEIAACLPYLRRQIALIQPRLIVLLGRAAAHAVLGDVGSLASLRGRSLEYTGPELDGRTIPVVVTYHPAYLLRTLPDKAKAWEDLCRARALMRSAKAAAGGPPSPQADERAGR
nr:uracil-DNA glycosylase [Accumulibacter sp.]